MTIVRRIRNMIASGKINHDLTRASLVALMGPPTDIGCTSRRRKIPCDYKYGIVEFMFGDKRDSNLLYVYVDDLHYAKGPVWLLEEKKS